MQEKHQHILMLLCLASCFIFLGAYKELLVGVLFIGFYAIVVESGKYEKLTDFFDRVF